MTFYTVFVGLVQLNSMLLMMAVLWEHINGAAT